MLADPLAANYDGATSITQSNFTILTLDGSSSVRGFTSAPAENPNILRISHSVVGKGASTRDRHLVRLEANGVDGGVRRTDIVGSVYLVADFPRDILFTSNTREALYRQFLGLIRGNSTWNAGSIPNMASFWSRWLNGEV